MRIFFRKVLYWAEEPQVRALVCLTFRVRMLCDAKRFLLSGGQASDVAYAQSLLDETYIPSLRGRPCQRCMAVGSKGQCCWRLWPLSSAVVRVAEGDRCVVTRFDKSATRVRHDRIALCHAAYRDTAD